MIGVLINTAAIVLGGSLGLLCKKGIPDSISTSVMHILGACVLCIGIAGITNSENTLVLLISSVIGVILGELLDIDGKMIRLGEFAERKAGTNSGNLSKGLIAGTLLFCSGAMGILGAIQAGSVNDNSTLIAKAFLDGTEAIIMAASLGTGIILSALFVLIYEGAFAVLSEAASYLMTDSILSDITAVGSLMMIILGLNIMDVTKIKVANLLPAIIISPIISVALHDLISG